MTSTTAEMAMPTISVDPVSTLGWRASPPVSTASPLARPSLAASLRVSRVASVSSVAFTLYVTCVYAVVPDALTVFAANGSAAAASWGPDSSPRTLPTASRFAGSVIFWPSGALKTRRAVAPSALAPG